MDIGIPKEMKIQEGRVGLIPAAAGECVHHGHTVRLESGAGLLSGYDDEDYRKVGVEVVPDAAALYEKSRLIVKVKEPVEPDLHYLRSEHRLFCYLHLAANPDLTQRLLDIGLTAVAFETVEEADGNLPLLAPMSDIAGRLATQFGAQLLHHNQGGKGLLLGGLPGAERGHVVVLGAGSVGRNAARVAAELGARVTVFERRRNRQESIRDLGPNVTALYPFKNAIAEAVSEADLVIGAILITGAKTPHMVSADMVRSMGKGSVIVDVAVDQGGCVETIRPTDYQNPTYLWEDIVHFGVTNMPGAVPKSASQALSASLLPYVLKVAEKDGLAYPEINKGINVKNGKIELSTLK